MSRNRSARYVVNLVVMSTALSCAYAGVFAGEAARAQSRYSLSASLDQEFTAGGIPFYKIFVWVSPFLSPEASIESLVAPDGTVAEVQTFLRQHSVNFHRLSLAAARSTFSGLWKFTEKRGEELLEYEFTLPDITPELFPETPTFVSHQHGDIVQPGFLLDWEYENGVQRRGPASFFGTDGISSLGRMEVDDTSAQFFFRRHDGSLPGKITASVGQTATRSIDMMPVSQDADATFTFNTLSITSFSLPISLIAVPEPGSLLLAGSSMLICTFRRRVRTR